MNRINQNQRFEELEKAFGSNKKPLTFNEVAQIYFEDRSQKNFNIMYEELRKIGMMAKAGLTVEKDDYESITTDLAMRLLNKFDTIYSNHKSIFAYVFLSYKTKYFSLLKKYNKYVREADMFRKGDEEDVNRFETILFQKTEQAEKTEHISVLHNSVDMQFSEFYKIIDEMYPEEKEFVKELFELRDESEVGNVSLFVSPEKVGAKYGIKNRTTISARRTRAFQKIGAELSKRVEESSKLDGDRPDGTYTIKGKEVTIENQKIVKVKFTEKSGSTTKKSLVEGGWLTEKFDKNGTKIMEGVRDLEGNKIGFWSFYHENGKVESRANYSHPNVTYSQFDSQGFGIEMGKLRQ